jgi:hypothetical protein
MIFVYFEEKYQNYFNKNYISKNLNKSVYINIINLHVLSCSYVIYSFIEDISLWKVKN